MLLDEPLTEVDHAKKTEMLPEFKKILQELSIPVLYITHDPREAALIGTSFMAMDANGVALVNSAEEAFSFIQ
jgi:molybdate transport system ATP-binding protein